MQISGNRHAVTDAAAHGFKVGTQIFDKSELIDGTLIRIAQGYEYRPEGWVALGQTNAKADRPATTSDELVIIDSSWWGNFNYRGFNIQKSGITADEAGTVFRIYIPV